MSQSNTSNTSSHPQPAVAGTPGSASLKAERIQEAVALTAGDVVVDEGGARLKAERIQLALRDLPGWTIQRGGIVRTVELADNREASRLLQYVAELGYDGEMPEVHVRRGRMTFVLPTVDDAYLEEPLFEMAKSLEVSA